uniref:Toll-like receptor 8 n=1 Tax=Gadus morhua TaxID=8049 RepID=A0A8C5A086_GADMO
MFQHSTNRMSRQFPCDVTGLVFDCQEKKLQKVPNGITSNATVVNVSKNELLKIQEYRNVFSHLDNLTELNLSHAKKSGNAPYPCVPCPNISLGIHPMAFIDLTKLRTLDLAGNSLTELNDFWFENLQDLTKLLLSFNLLQSAFQGELTCFSSLSKLQHLDLSFNYGHNTYPQTVKLSNSFSKLRSLQLSLHGNPFQCSCEALDFIIWIENNNVMIYFDFDQCVNDTLALLISILTTTFIVVTKSMATVSGWTTRRCTPAFTLSTSPAAGRETEAAAWTFPSFSEILLC